MIGGLGSGMNSVASLALIVSNSKESEREMNIGMIEMATGVGFLMGPMWGSLMYQIGGFTLPFGSMGKHLFLLTLNSNYICSGISLRCLQYVPGKKGAHLGGSGSQHKAHTSRGRGAKKAI